MKTRLLSGLFMLLLATSGLADCWPPVFIAAPETAAAEVGRLCVVRLEAVALGGAEVVIELESGPPDSYLVGGFQDGVASYDFCFRPRLEDVGTHIVCIIAYDGLWARWHSFLLIVTTPNNEAGKAAWQRSKHSTGRWHPRHAGRRKR